MAMTQDELIDAIGGMTVLELADLVKALEEKFGVKAAVAAWRRPQPRPPPAVAPLLQRPRKRSPSSTSCSRSSARRRSRSSRSSRELTALGLKEAKDLVEAAPKPVEGGDR